MKFEDRFEKIINNVHAGKGPDKEDCIYLLGYEPHSLESTHMMSLANNICRTRFSNSAMIYAQVGIDVAPCAADCKFCSFGASNANVDPYRMSSDEIKESVGTLAGDGDLFGLFLMTMETVDMDFVLDAVNTARSVMLPHQQLWVNIGDISYDEAVKLKKYGVNGAYHVLRLREGEDSELDPEERIKTFEALNRAELQLFTCCEPIGPEHSANEIFDRVFFNYQYNLVQQSAMRRTFIPSLPISKRGVISKMRLAQITAIITLSMTSYPEVVAMASHEPNLLSLSAGSNIVSAEWGANPRDDTDEKSEKLGLTMNDCRLLLFESGYSSVLTNEFKQIPINEEYLVKMGAL